MAVIEIRPDSELMSCVLKDAEQRFLSRMMKFVDIDPETGCWNHSGARTGDGYSMTYVSGKMRLAHRVFYELIIGPLKDNFEIDHKCRNRSCVNPDHLAQLTRKEHLVVGKERLDKRKLCQNGHPWSENKFVNSNGNAECLVCNRISKTRYNRKKRAECDGLHDLTLPDALYSYPQSRRKVCRICKDARRKQFAGVN